MEEHEQPRETEVQTDGTTTEPVKTCKTCKDMLGIIVATRICQEAQKEGVDCEKLTEDLRDNTISTEEYINRIKDKFPEGTKERSILHKVEKVMGLEKTQ